MATYYSDRYTVSPASSTTYTHATPRPNKPGESIFVRGTVTVATNLATGDKIRLCPMAKGMRLKSFMHQWGDLDSSTTLVMHLGQETSDPDAYLASSTQYQSADATVASGGGANSLDERDIELVADNAATTAEDHLAFTVVTGATSLAASTTITFVAELYLPG